MTTPHDPTGSFSPLDAVIATYLQAVESGDAPDRGAILDQHPDLAGPLRDFFADFDRIDHAAAPFRLVVGSTAAEALAGPTLATTVRYFGDYELLEEVARGGMGVVYRARQASLNRVVALKMVLAGGHASPRAVQRFRLEAEAAANLDHPGIVPIHEVGEHEGLQYFSMKFVAGVPLGRHPLGSFREEAAGLVAVSRAVHHAHQHGVLHRDLKPSNILVDPQAGWLVTDFGLAKRLADVDGSLTETGDILGTPRYMAPEQAAGRRDLTVAADIYSLGAILFERLTGRAPFLADNVVTLLHQVRESDPPRPSTLVPNLDRDLETIVLKCLDKAPTRRYPSAEALALDLENWRAGRPITARPVGPANRAWRWCQRNPAVSVLVAAVAVSLLVGTAVSITFALKADARALEAGLAATRLQILLAKSYLEAPPNSVDNTPRAPDEGLLTLARAFAQAPADRSADDLRWCILANLALEAQQRRPLLLDRQPGEPPAAVSALSPDGRRWAEAGPDGTVKVWDIAAGRLLMATPRHSRSVWRIVFSPNGDRFATIALGDRGWGLRAGMDNFSNPLAGAGPQYMTAWKSRDEADRVVRVWDLARGSLLAEFLHDTPAQEARFSRNGKRLFSWPFRQDQSFGAKATSIVWEIPEQGSVAPSAGLKPTFTFPGNLEECPDGETYVIHETETPRYRFHAAPGGHHLFDIPSEGTVFRWAPSGRELATVACESSADSDELEYRLRFIEAASGKILGPNPLVRMKAAWYSDAIVRYSPDGRFLAIGPEAPGPEEPEVHVISRATGQRLATLPGATQVNFSPDGAAAILANGQIFDTATWRRLAPPLGRRFHPRLRESAKLGRVFGGIDATWDLATELTVETAGRLWNLPDIPERPEGLVCWSKADWPSLLPREPFATDAKTVELWAEVLTRKRLAGEQEAEPLTEPDWEAKRGELLRRLPPSPSPLLIHLATDRAHWRREAAKLSHEISLHVTALDRLIELEPAWYYRHCRGLTLAQLKRWEAAARDFLAVGREVGDWYWESPPSILDDDTLSTLLLDDQPERTLRESIGQGPEVAEVAMRYLAFLRRQDDRLRQVVAVAMCRPSPSPAQVKKALEITERLTRDGGGLIEARAVRGMALYRAGRYREAEIDLSQVARQWRDQSTGGGFEDLPVNLTRVRMFLAMSHARLGQAREAKDWLVQVENGLVGPIDHELFQEARVLVKASAHLK